MADAMPGEWHRAPVRPPRWREAQAPEKGASVLLSQLVSGWAGFRPGGPLTPKGRVI